MTIAWKTGDYVIVRGELYQVVDDGRQARLYQPGHTLPRYIEHYSHWGSKCLNDWFNKYPDLFLDSPLNNRATTHLGEE